jgi:predicted nucleic acid-binding Zn ribbon protein
MAQLSIGDALHLFFKNAHWKARMDEIRLQSEWEKIMGATIAKYTKEIKLKEGTLIIATDIAPLKHELQMAKDQIKANINEYFKENIILEVRIK